ncbi:DNA-binding response regulator [Streptomyces sp. NPDC002573]|uniref:response regulator transcription factor n=1 Tax=Streptomyces sp. NPDC002573 TaxID=3364651 RepID=UPI0036B848B4
MWLETNTVRPSDARRRATSRETLAGLRRMLGALRQGDMESVPFDQTPGPAALDQVDDDYVYGALRAGASGFLVKDMPLETILDGIRVVAAGDALIAPSVTRRLIEEFAARPEPAAARQVLVDGITSREREVLTLVGRGLSNTEIAQELFISVATAKAHLARLFTKLDARDRVHLVILAYETGLVSPSR